MSSYFKVIYLSREKCNLVLTRAVSLIIQQDMNLKDIVFTNKQTVDLAKRVGCTRAHIWYIIKGERIPSPKMADKISKALDGKITRLQLLYPE